jgi:hypothetical protein
MVTELLRSRPAAPVAAAAGLLVRRGAACAEVFLPAAPPAIVTSGVAGWAFGAWVSLGAPAQLFVPSYAHIVNWISAVSLVDTTVELAYGAGYTPLDCAREIAPFFNPGANTVWALPLSLMCQPGSSPAGQTVYVRAATQTATPYDYEVILIGWLGGLPTFATVPLAVITGPGRWYPANTYSSGITATSGAGWTWGPGATVVAAAPNDMLVVGLKNIAVVSELLDTGTMWQIGYGAAGSETWCATAAIGHMWSNRWIWPPVLVKAGERLAVRAAYVVAGSRDCQVKVYDL